MNAIVVGLPGGGVLASQNVAYSLMVNRECPRGEGSTRENDASGGNGFSQEISRHG